MLSQKYSNLRVKNSLVNLRGFTLIEVLIVIAIMGILSAIALPQYFSYVEKTRRSDAQASLLFEVQSMERCRASTQTYVGCEVSSAESTEAYYTISVTTSTTGYTLTAQGQNQQANDTECSTMTLNDQGIRTPAPSTTKCWPN